MSLMSLVYVIGTLCLEAYPRPSRKGREKESRFMIWFSRQRYEKNMKQQRKRGKSLIVVGYFPFNDHRGQMFAYAPNTPSWLRKMAAMATGQMKRMRKRKTVKRRERVQMVPPLVNSSRMSFFGTNHPRNRQVRKPPTGRKI